MSAVLLATDRLAASRARLRQAMQADAARSAADAQAAGPAGRWLRSLESIPGAGVVIKAVREWWSQHPLHIAGMAAAGAAKAAVQPLARRHPLALVLGAAVFGGLIVLTRPWRWMFRPGLFAGLLPRLFQGAAAQVTAQTWIAMLAGLLQAPGRSASEDGTAPAGTAQATPPVPAHGGALADDASTAAPLTFH